MLYHAIEVKIKPKIGNEEIKVDERPKTLNND